MDNINYEGRWSILTFILIILIMCIIDIIQYNDTIESNSQTQLLSDQIGKVVKEIEADLNENVCYQFSAVNAITENMKQLPQLKDKVNNLCLIGPSGVGKTFVANIIKRHFKNYNMNELYGLLANKHRLSNLLANLNKTTNNFSIIILDDLSVKDVEVLINFIQILPNNHSILTISIFNIQEIDENFNKSLINYDNIKEVQGKLNQSGLDYKLAVFHEFTRNQVQDCLRKAYISKFGEDCSILDDILNDHDLKFEGFKRLHLKVSEHLQ